MSYYIEFKTKPLRLKRDTPLDVIAFLNAVINDDNWEVAEPKHDLFDLERWGGLFVKNSYKNTSFLYQKARWVLIIECEINYGIDEVDEFAKWIAPYVIGHKPKEFIGVSRGDGLRFWDNVYIIRSQKLSTI